MVTQITFKTDGDLKKAAMQKVKSEGITLKALLMFCMKGYIEGKINLGIITESSIEEIKVTPKIQKKMDKIAKII